LHHSGRITRHSETGPLLALRVKSHSGRCRRIWGTIDTVAAVERWDPERHESPRSAPVYSTRPHGRASPIPAPEPAVPTNRRKQRQLASSPETAGAQLSGHLSSGLRPGLRRMSQIAGNDVVRTRRRGTFEKDIVRERYRSGGSPANQRNFPNQFNSLRRNRASAHFPRVLLESGKGDSPKAL